MKSADRSLSANFAPTDNGAVLTVAVNLQEFYDFCEKQALCSLYMANERFSREQVLC